jgi:hypothetical protein
VVNLAAVSGVEILRLRDPTRQTAEWKKMSNCLAQVKSLGDEVRSAFNFSDFRSQ